MTLEQVLISELHRWITTYRPVIEYAVSSRTVPLD
jgi:hypothetical protein